MTESPDRPLDVYLAAMVASGASDLFLQPGDAPTLRINGQLLGSDLPTPDDALMQRCADQVLTPIAAEHFAASPDLDVACAGPDGQRFRINLFMHQGQLGLVARHIPSGGIDFAHLNLPDQVTQLADARQGLILVVGPTGCGKSTTLAAMIHRINQNRRQHIVTIEDPIEFLHTPDQALIHQRQVGYDTRSFATALRHVVRQSPDVILIGEMRDAETMETALNAAMTGHLVLSTLHTNNIVQSVDRILNYFPPGARAQAQTDLAATLIGMMSMRLLPRSDGKGRVPAIELLLGTPRVRRLITEGQFSDIYDAMKRGREKGMMTMNQSLVDLCKAGLVDEDDALPVSPNRDEFRLNMQGMYTGVESIDIRTEDRDDEGLSLQ